MTPEHTLFIQSLKDMDNPTVENTAYFFSFLDEAIKTTFLPNHSLEREQFQKIYEELLRNKVFNSLSEDFFGHYLIYITFKSALKKWSSSEGNKNYLEPIQTLHEIIFHKGQNSRPSYEKSQHFLDACITELGQMYDLAVKVVEGKKKKTTAVTEAANMVY